MPNPLTFIPTMHFPGSLYSGNKSLQYLSVLRPEDSTILTSVTAWKNFQELFLPLAVQIPIIKREGEPTLDMAAGLVQELRQSGRKTLIAVGGGSIVDLAKHLKRELSLQLVAVPTTLGSGAEVSQHVVLANERTSTKTVHSGAENLPHVILLDARLYSTLSRQQMVLQCFDGLAHAVESYVSRMANPLSDGLALAGLELLWPGLQILASSPPPPAPQLLDRLKAGAIFAGLAQSSAATGLAHSFGHVIGARLHLPHAETIARFFPDVIRFNAAKVAKLSQLTFVGIEQKQLPNELERLLRDSGVSFTPLHFDGDAASLAEMVRKDICTLTNPVAPTMDDVLSILRKHL